MNVTTIEAEALHLPVGDRAKLAHRLLASLDSVSEADAQILWVAAAEHRLDEIRSGAVSTISADDFQSGAAALFS